jgi:hypothetical protein
MNLRSPIVAMLWEQWRLTRVEAAQRLVWGVAAASAATILFRASATVAFGILFMTNAMIWFSIAKLNGGRFMDGYKPGFPLYLLYTRPIPTVVIVGVAMVYDAVSSIALYLVSAAIVGFALNQPIPLFSATLLLLVSHVWYACVQWSTPSRTVQWVGSILFSLPIFYLIQNRTGSMLQLEFSLLENALMILSCVVAFGLTVAGVARQRRGDAAAAAPRVAGPSGAYPVWLVTLFRFQCPTSSAMRAQVWYELRSSGLPVLMIGAGVAILISLLYTIAISFAPARHAAVVVTFFSLLIVLLALGGNAFGIRRKQGRTYASAFEATQPYGTAQLVGIKVLVRTACVLVALLAIAVSVWTSSSLVEAWGGWFVDGKNDASQGLIKLRGTIGDSFGGQTGYAHAAQMFIASVVVAGTVAWLAAREALRARYRRGLLVAQWLPVVWVVAMILITLAGRNGIVPEFLAGTIFRATFWICAAAMVITTIYLFWSGFAEHVLTMRYAAGALASSVAFGVALVAVLQPAGIPPEIAAGIVWVALLLLMGGVIAPWSFSRVRHI